MHAAITQPTTDVNRPVLLAVAWGATLLVSTLPDIFLRELAGQNPAWLIWAKLGLLAGLVALTFAWKAIRPLRLYFIVFLVLYPAEWAFGWFGQTAYWRSFFPGGSFSNSMMGTQLLRLGVALVMVAAMFALKRRRSEFFLVQGQLDAPVEPIRWLGVGPNETWMKFGRNLAVIISLGTLTFLVVAGRPSPAVLVKALPMLPLVLLFAAMNAFSEEMSYRASFLSTLHNTVGKSQALLLTAAFFGIGHFYGVPYGVVGVLMAGFLGWLLGKSMLETRGFAWAWFIHFLQDVLIFAFLVIGSVTPGGM